MARTHSIAHHSTQAPITPLDAGNGRGSPLPNGSFICRIRIRTLLFLVLTLLSSFAIIAIFWNGTTLLYNKEQHVWTQLTNTISSTAIQLTNQMAIERGLTTMLIRSNDPAEMENSRPRIARLRESVDHSYLEMIRLVDQLSSLFPQNEVAREKQQVIDAYHHLSEARRVVDHGEDGTKVLITNEWFATASRLIDTTSQLRRIAMRPINQREQVHRDNALVKELLFAASEYAGRNRAIIAKNIAANTPIPRYEQELLEQHQGITIHNLNVAFQEINHIADSPLVGEAMKQVRTLYLDEHLRLFRHIIDSQRRSAPYPIPADEWFDKATFAIDSIITLSWEVSRITNRRIASMEAEANRMQLIGVASMVMIVLISAIAFLLTYRRIASPLSRLETSARHIIDGNLNTPITLSSSDEFGQLADTLEQMRSKLVHDMVERDHAIVELEKLTKAIEQSLSSIIITDDQGIVEYVNPQFTRTTGYKPGDIIGHKSNKLRSGRTPIDTYRELWSTIKNGYIWEAELINKKKSGELYWEFISISPIRNKHNEITHFISVQHDISEKKSLENRIDYLAYHDDLTHLPNKMVLEERFKHFTSNASTDQHGIGLLMLDIDRFKIINESYGHSVGDSLLVMIANRLITFEGLGDTIIRHGGDEFILIVSQNDSGTIVDRSRQLLNMLAQPLNYNGRSIHLTASIGIALYPQDGNDLETLIKHADAAMYDAKSNGGNTFSFFEESMNIAVVKRLDTEHELRRAIEQHEFTLYYQPQINVSTNRFDSAEALIRWRKPNGVIVSPYEFIPVAEETGQIIEIGHWIIEEACRQIAEWNAQTMQGLSVAINLSPRQFLDDDLMSTLNEAIQRHNIDGNQLEIEITESVLMHNRERADQLLRQMRELGISIAIDDFGTGYSSLAYLQNLPIDTIKIDRSFISCIGDSDDGTAIVSTIIAMSKTLHLNTVAEGIETERQRLLLTKMGANFLQGYYFSNPLPPKELEHFFLLRKTPTKQS